MHRTWLVLAGLLLIASIARAEVAADPAWTRAEAWAWLQIAGGRTADFDAKCHAFAVPESDDSTWTDPCRAVRGIMLEQILTRAPWQGATQHHGVQIKGARVVGNLDLSNAHITSAVILTHGRIEGDVLLARAHLDGLFALDGSVIAGAVDGIGLSSESDLSLSDDHHVSGCSKSGVDVHGPVTLLHSRIKGSVFLNCGHFQQKVELSGTRIEADVQTGGATFEAGLWGGSVQIAGKLSINSTRFKKEVLFPNSTIGVLVDTSKSMFEGKLNLADTHVAGDVFMNEIQAASGLDIFGLNTGGYLRLVGANFKGPVNAAHAQIAGDVELDRDAYFDDSVTLAAARLGGSLLMSRTPFGGKVSLRGTHVVGDVQMANANFGKDLDILALHVDGDLVMTGSKVEGDLNAANLDVKFDLSLNSPGPLNTDRPLNTTARVGGKVNLFDAHVGNSVHMERATFAREIIAPNFHAMGDMYFDNSVFGSDVILTGARIGGALKLAGISIGKLDLTGAVVDGALVVSTDTTWRQPARPNAPQLTLVNAKAGALQDGMVYQPDACPTDDHPPSNGWPTAGGMELDGFTYGHLPTGGDMPERSVCWWRWWLERNREFSTQPYVQLASVMAAHGDQDNAFTVQYFGRVGETGLAWDRSQYARWIFLTVLNWAAGFGIGLHTFWVLVWFGVLTLIGIVLLKRAPGSRQRPLLWCTGASLSRILPGIEINKELNGTASSWGAAASPEGRW
jgi:hypothetical protein